MLAVMAVMAVMAVPVEPVVQEVLEVAAAWLDQAALEVQLATVVPVSFCRVARTVLPIRGQSLVALV